jgi:hypothetical protein
VLNTPDGRLVGGRHDGIGFLDEQGEPRTELVKFDQPKRCNAFRLSPDARRVIWADLAWPPQLRWWLSENGQTRLIVLRTASNTVDRLASAMWLSNDKILIHVFSPRREQDLWIADPDGGKAEAWLPAAMPRGVSWAQVSPWGNALAVIGQAPPARTDSACKGAQCAVRLEQGAAVAQSLGDADVGRLPLVNFNRGRSLTRPIVWAPGKPAYARSTTTKDLLVFTDPSGAEPPSRIVIVHQEK